MKFIFVRHAQSEANKIHVYADPESPLTPEGVRQSQEAADFFNPKIDRIFCSPYKRTLQTAEPFARKLNLPVVVHEDLREKSYGSFVGSSVQEAGQIMDNHPEFNDPKWGRDYTYFGGESGVQVRDRVIRFVEEIKRTYSDQRILVITHAGVIRAMHWLYGNKEGFDFLIANISIHEFDL